MLLYIVNCIINKWKWLSSVHSVLSQIYSYSDMHHKLYPSHLQVYLDSFTGTSTVYGSSIILGGAGFGVKKCVRGDISNTRWF